MQDIAGKTAIVAGAASGIGLGIGLGIARSSDNIVYRCEHAHIAVSNEAETMGAARGVDALFRQAKIEVRSRRKHPMQSGESAHKNKG